MQEMKLSAPSSQEGGSGVSAYQKLVEENHGLIYAFCNKNRYDIDEYYDLVAISLCNAARIYEPSKGAFSTLAFRCMERDCIKEYRKRQVRNPDGIVPVPLFSHMPDDEEKNDRRPELADKKDYLEDVETGVDIERFRRSLNERELDVLRKRLIGETYGMIGKELGFTGEYIRLTMKRIREKYEAIVGR